MTVTTELARKSFPWTGVETAFSCGFPAEDVSHLRVFFTTPGGITSALTMGVNYSASLASGSKIATVLPILIPAAAGTVTVERRTPALVTEVLADGQDYSLEVIQRMHDRAAMIAAEYRTRLSRAIVLEDGSEGGSGAFDMGGNRLSNVGAGLLPSDAATVAQLQGIGGAQGNVPSPVLGQVGFALFALAPGVFGWVALPAAADGAISNAKLSNMASGTVKGRASAGDGPPEDLNQAQQRTLLGITAPGLDLMTALTKAAQRAALQITAAGEALLLSPDVATQRLLLGVIADAPSDGKLYGRKDGAYAEFVAGGVTDTDRRSLVLAHERTAKLSPSRLLIFGGVVDGFAGTDGIAGSSTNYSHDPTNKRVTPTVAAGTEQIPTMTAATTSGVTMSDSGNYGAGFEGWKAGDKNDATFYGQNPFISGGYIQVDLGSGNAKTIAAYSIRGQSTNYPTAFKLAGSNDGSSFTDLDTRTGQSWAGGTETKSYTVASPASYRYHRFIFTACSSTVNTALEVGLQTAGTVNALSLVTTTLTVDAAPASIRVGILADLTETITSADFTAEATRTGAAWALGTLAPVKIGGNLWYYETVIDVSGQASGTSVAARLKTANGKSLRILAVSVEVVA